MSVEQSTLLEFVGLTAAQSFTEISAYAFHQSATLIGGGVSCCDCSESETIFNDCESYHDLGKHVLGG
ncbi:MAG TPA: hypothetical protein PLL88_04655 [Anaerolineaceae bacterium]|nr:hypothetical protein [Anaerolineaceae bacterium]